jgi:ActR/RegA family two-component response regulator
MMTRTQTETWRIQHVDHDEDDHILIRSMLSEFHGRTVDVDWAPTIEEGRQKLLNQQYQAVLVDYDMSVDSGIRLIREFSSRSDAPPMILLTGRGSYDVDVEAMHAGATLYLTKNEINPLLLERLIRYAIEHQHTEARLRQSEEKFSRAFNQGNFPPGGSSCRFGCRFFSRQGRHCILLDQYLWQKCFLSRQVVKKFSLFHLYFIHPGVYFDSMGIAVMGGKCMWGGPLRGPPTYLLRPRGIPKHLYFQMNGTTGADPPDLIHKFGWNRKGFRVSAQAAQHGHLFVGCTPAHMPGADHGLIQENDNQLYQKHEDENTQDEFSDDHFYSPKNLSIPRLQIDSLLKQKSCAPYHAGI